MTISDGWGTSAARRIDRAVESLTRAMSSGTFCVAEASAGTSSGSSASSDEDAFSEGDGGRARRRRGEKTRERRRDEWERSRSNVVGRRVAERGVDVADQSSDFSGATKVARR